MAVPADARDFRKALDGFVEDFLRVRGEIEDSDTISPRRARTQREEYQWLRRRVVDAYRGVEEPFAEFVQAEPEHDLRTGDRLGLDPDAPITSWWRALTLDEALDRFQDADEGALREQLHRQHAVLDAFADWLRRRPEARPAEAPKPPAAATRGSWLDNEWVVGVGVTTIGGLIVVLIVYVVSH